jgi:hypothetical protein
MSNKRIPEHVRARVRELRAEGKLYSQITRMTGVCRNSIWRICGGKPGSGRRATKDDNKVFDGPDTSVPATWCDKCRVKVYHPCVACRARRFMATKKANL